MYSDWDDDFYCPSDFDEKVDEWKASLRESVKEEFKARMAELEAENTQLQEIKKNWSAKVAELEREKEQAVSEAKRAAINAQHMRTEELLKETLPYAFCVYATYKTGPKCDKCDEDRYIHYKSPQGYDRAEKCDCSIQEVTYAVKRVPLIKLYPKDNHEQSLGPVYLVHIDSVDSYKYTAERFFDTVPFDTIRRCDIPLFETEEKAKAYADYCNRKEQAK